MRTTGPGPRPPRALLGAALTALTALVVGVVWTLWPHSASAPERRESASSATSGGTSSEAPDPATPSTPMSPAPDPDPSSGSLDPVPYEEVTPEPALPLSATADFGTGLTLAVLESEAVRSKASGPGEISAPALRLTMRLRNASGEPIDIEGMVVSLEYGTARTPAVDVHQPGGAPFGGVLAPGATTRGVYVFNVPVSERDQVRVTTSYTGTAPTVVLAGSLS
ncbi:hypothetical protein [Nocardioides sp. cx-173]|uniref:hypothetical protein n=1 Tax=Nocardioides sp. cx-173 TaxID=2898796 RepID=UPI001E4C6E7D|nr:hypothetical protein [Nocardioides sp. cx-173]MCD4527479.1 hypothetical protein [Nocardioides sp. cx-173]UGB40334.1 hypothetical protein LQ940_13165 [Nocardioides sp. cx-173]